MEKQQLEAKAVAPGGSGDGQNVLIDGTATRADREQQKTVSVSSQAPFDRGNGLVTIIVPVFNEEAALPLVLDDLFRILDDSYEVLVVDDGSSDDSVVVAQRYPCRLVIHKRNLGKGAALRTGLQEARGDKVIFIDADNTYPVDMIPAMAQRMDKYDLVRGVRLLGREHIPLVNRMGNRLFDQVIRMLHSVEGDDLLSGMYGGCRNCLLKLALDSEGFDIEAEINVKARAYGLSCATMPIAYYERVGEKKLKAVEDGLRILYRVLQLTVTHNPLAFFILPGLALFLLGTAGVGWMLVAPTALNNPVLAMHGALGLGVIAALGGQLAVFGLAVYAAAIGHGLCGRESSLLDRISESLVGNRMRLVALLVGTVGFFGLIWDTAYRMANGHDPYTSPAVLVFLSLCLLFGFQLLSLSAFLSAFRGLETKLSSGPEG